jgi:hypothetical protein
VTVWAINRGEDVILNEFSHAAALGYTQESGLYEFKCGGSLISEK